MTRNLPSFPLPTKCPLSASPPPRATGGRMINCLSLRQLILSRNQKVSLTPLIPSRNQGASLTP